MANVKKAAKTTTDGLRSVIPVERIERSILLIREQRVLLDLHLAALYGVPVKQLNQAVKRNADRFPADFMFQLTWDESRVVRSQIVTLQRGHLRYQPHAFTEHGAVMLASVLKSDTAITVSIQVVRAFVRLRQMISSNEQMRRKLSRIERKLQDHDQHFAAVFDAIRQLMDEEEGKAPKRPPIGYDTETMLVNEPNLNEQ
jgi:hypothetical protein